MTLERNCHLNQRFPMEMFLSSCLKKGFSHFINKLSLRSNLNLLESVAKIMTSSKFMAQLQGNRWSDTADCLTFLRSFPVRLEIPCKGEFFNKRDKPILNRTIKTFTLELFD